MFISKRQPIHKEFRQARIALFFVDAAVLLSIVLGIAPHPLWVLLHVSLVLMTAWYIVTCPSTLTPVAD